ncbi:uncharacterized protein VTP21DRAFT_6004 [Calcarisporiella thermophila]|uniref:uncharacterized protein n=1 Tax=Calcarisporiella thermophila TaxID=911321 RepID=UPI003743B4EF
MKSTSITSLILLAIIACTQVQGAPPVSGKETPGNKAWATASATSIENSETARVEVGNTTLPPLSESSSDVHIKELPELIRSRLDQLKEVFSEKEIIEIGKMFNDNKHSGKKGQPAAIATARAKNAADIAGTDANAIATAEATAVAPSDVCNELAKRKFNCK